MLARAVAIWAVLVTVAAAAGDLSGPTGLVGGAALSAVVLTAAVLCTVRVLAGVAPTGSTVAALGSSVRARTRRIRPTRLTDPDAPGRPRPRAPGATPWHAS